MCEGIITFNSIPRTVPTVPSVETGTVASQSRVYHHIITYVLLKIKCACSPTYDYQYVVRLVIKIEISGRWCVFFIILV